MEGSLRARRLRFFWAGVALVVLFVATVFWRSIFHLFDNGSDMPRTEMVLIPGGVFTMGCADCKMDDAVPLHSVQLDSFWMDATPVTNAQYAAFVQATGYKTVAERPLNPQEFPGVPPEALQPGSIVFTPPAQSVDLRDIRNWWRYVPGASWQHPEGPGTHWRGREDHPVVHIAYEDAQAYAKWAVKRLPTEAEFEYAARGGHTQFIYAWGNELKPAAGWQANIWQGNFPHANTLEDGYAGTSPVKAFPATAWGLYDMGGNVWQWCSDWYRVDYYTSVAGTGVLVNPKGPATSFDPQEPGVNKRVQRGGSFLCSDQYCERYLVGSRGRGEVNSASSNVGFRCVRDLR